MKDRARERRGWASHRGFTNCHSEEGRGFVPKNGHAGLFFESDLCSPTPHPPSRQEQNKLFLLWEEEEKMCSVIRSLIGSQANRKESHQERVYKVFVSLHVRPPCCTSTSAICVCWLTATSHNLFLSTFPVQDHFCSHLPSFKSQSTGK